MKFRIIYITFPTIREAKKIAKILIKEKLVACCNILPINSIYKWRGRIVEEKEVVMLVKTKAELVGKIIKRIKKLHSFEIPCIISLEIKEGNSEFLSWLSKIVK
ncbi:MAG: divalent-cation tolerance protein CutA [Minisyncoccales bacterium]